MKRKRKVLLGSLSAFLTILFLLYLTLFCTPVVFARQYKGTDSPSYVEGQWLDQYKNPMVEEVQLENRKGFGIKNVTVYRYHHIGEPYFTAAGTAQEIFNGHLIWTEYQNKTGKPIEAFHGSVQQWLNGKWYDTITDDAPVSLLLDSEDSNKVHFCTLANLSRVSTNHRDGKDHHTKTGVPFYGRFRVKLSYQINGQLYADYSEPFFVFPWGNYETYSWEDYDKLPW